MSKSEQGHVLATLLGALKGFAHVVREAVACGRLGGAGLSPRAEILYDSLLWSSGEEAVDFLEALPEGTRLAVEDLLDALLEHGSGLDPLLEVDAARGAQAVSQICALVQRVAEVAAADFGELGLEAVSACRALGEVAQSASQQLRAA